MSRVLLFVQTGDARPKCKGGPRVRCAHITSMPVHGVRETCDACRGTGYLIGSSVNADRWWLVECETAYHGRKVIEAAARGEQTVGRILASGGRP